MWNKDEELAAELYDVMQQEMRSRNRTRHRGRKMSAESFWDDLRQETLRELTREPDRGNPDDGLSLSDQDKYAAELDPPPRMLEEGT